jgi:hypothetical protein
MTPMVLGSAYLGGFSFFVRVLSGSRWNVANRRYAAPAGPDELHLGPVTRWVVGLIGVLALVQGPPVITTPNQHGSPRTCH